MRQVFNFLALFITTFIFLSCKPSYHYGYMGTEHAPLLNSRKSEISNYTGIGISAGGASNENENSITAKLFHQTNYTQDFFSLAAHADTYYGSYSVEAVEEFQGETFQYYGVAPQVMASMFYPFKSGRLGLYSSIGTFWEFGSYPDWLEATENDSLFIFHEDDYLGKIWFGSVGILHEVIYSKNKMLTFQLGTGKPGLLHGYTSFHNRKYVISLGVSLLIDESGSFFINYMRKW